MRRSSASATRRLWILVSLYVSKGWLTGVKYLIRVLDPENESAALGRARRKVVEEGCPQGAQVEISRGRRRESCADREIGALAEDGARGWTVRGALLQSLVLVSQALEARSNAGCRS